MIDFVKIVLKDIDTVRLLNLDVLDFNTVVSVSTGLVSAKKEASYHYGKITVYDNGLVLFSGSIHKLYNSLKGIKAPNYNTVKQYKGFNGNDFTISQILEVREHLQKLFGCSAEQMIFQNNELGINIPVSFNPKLFIKGLLYHNGKEFEYRFNNHLAQVLHQRYILKVYDKSSQYQMSKPTLRFEVKIIKMEELRYLGLRTFADITPIMLDKAKELVLKRFDEIVAYDYTINKKDLSNAQKRALKDYSNPRYWAIKLKPKLRYRHKQRLQNLIHNHSENLKQEIRQNLIKKCRIINQHLETPKSRIINHSSKRLNIHT